MKRMLALCVVPLALLVCGLACAQEGPFPYQNPNLPVEERVKDLLGRMTLEEKVAQLGGDQTGMSTPRNERLGIPGFTMSDGPHGVRTGKGTCFPPLLGMGATWDPELMEQVGSALGREFRARGRYVALGPCMNLIRDPRGGRSFETFGEDPWHVGRMAVAYVKGMQRERCVATAKHYACNNQENGRSGLPVQVDERVLREQYLPHFEAVIKEGGCLAVMSAYNKVNGFYCAENRHLQRDILKVDWGFPGIVMSDWGACHSTVPSILGGLDVEMPRANFYGQPLLDAVRKGEVSEALIDDAVRRILRVKFWAGAFEQMPVADEKLINTPATQALARQAAREACVLLKNDGDLLPLDRAKLKSIAVFGPNAATARPTGGGSSRVTPYYAVSPLDGIKSKLGADFSVQYLEGCSLEAFGNATAIPTGVLSPAGGKPGETGLTAEFFSNQELKGEPVLRRVDKQVDFNWASGAPDPKVPKDHFSVRWSGKITAPVTGQYQFTVATDDGVRLFVDGKRLINWWQDHGEEQRSATYNMEAGKSYDLRMEYYENGALAVARLQWALPNQETGDFSEVRDMAAKADACIVCVGTSASIETEGRDRAHLKLAGLQDELVKAVAATNRNTIVCVASGSAVLMDQWVDQVPAVMQTWFGGQEQGNAIADVLFGDFNPCGKLPLTLPRTEEQLPPFDAKYETMGEGRGYRYYEGKGLEPLFAFGHGMSYTRFEYGPLEVRPGAIASGKRVRAGVEVRNVGPRAGDEVVQFYVRDPECSVDRPQKELKAFARVHLEPGETKRVMVHLGPEAMHFWDVKTGQFVVEPGRFDVLVGASSRDIRASACFVVK
jgi:beta-glucosidase